VLCSQLLRRAVSAAHGASQQSKRLKTQTSVRKKSQTTPPTQTQTQVLFVHSLCPSGVSRGINIIRMSSSARPQRCSSSPETKATHTLL